MTCNKTTEKWVIWLINNIWDSLFLHIRKALFWITLAILAFLASVWGLVLFLDYSCFNIVIEECCD